MRIEAKLPQVGANMAVDTQWILAAIVVGGTILLSLAAGQRRGSKWPPGPSKLPLIGNLHQLTKGGNLLYLTFANWAEEHGKVMAVWLGGWRPVIVVTGHEQVWEVLVTKSSDFATHELAYTLKYLSAGWRTVFTSDYGPYWLSLRKGITNSVMNPSNISAQVCMQESDLGEMLDALGLEASQKCGAVRPLMHLKRSTIRLMCRLLLGFNFQLSEEFIVCFARIIDDTDRLTRISGIANIAPLTRYIPGLNRPFQEWTKIRRRIEELFCPLLTLSEPNTYLHFLKAQNLPDEVIIANISELLFLSVDSISATIAWGLAFLIHNQEAQQKLYDEIKSFSGEKGRASVQDVSNMKYVHAVVKETMRMKPIAPLAFPHKAANDTVLMGTKIAKGTTVIVNLHQVLNDPKVWEEPHVFTPERFLHDGGERSRATDLSFIPFGAGRRVCAGMDLAKLHVPVVIANLVGAYHWFAVNGQPPDMTEEFNGILMMKTPIAAQIERRVA